jgi:hypothetical protein
MRKLFIIISFSVLIACNNNSINREKFNTALSKDTVASKADSSQSATQQEEKERIERLTNSITMTIYDKGFNRIGNHNYTRFDIAIKNKSDQVIIGVKGRFVIDNLFGDHLKNYNLKYDETNIKPGQTIKITRYWDYDKTAKEDERIRETSLAKLNINYQPELVLFADGSKLQ